MTSVLYFSVYRNYVGEHYPIIYYHFLDGSGSGFNVPGLGSLPGLGGIGSINFMDLQQRMQREVMSNPETLGQLMSNPFVQQLMSDPNNMRSIFMSNPQMQELMEVNSSSKICSA